jgi:hypothetical protein
LIQEVDRVAQSRRGEPMEKYSRGGAGSEMNSNPADRNLPRNPSNLITV